MCGGNYDGDDLTERGKNFAVTKDGGKTWDNVEPEKSPSKSTSFLFLAISISAIFNFKLSILLKIKIIIWDAKLKSKIIGGMEG